MKYMNKLGALDPEVHYDDDILYRRINRIMNNVNIIEKEIENMIVPVQTVHTSGESEEEVLQDLVRMNLVPSIINPIADALTKDPKILFNKTDRKALIAKMAPDILSALGISGPLGALVPIIVAFMYEKNKRDKAKKKKRNERRKKKQVDEIVRGLEGDQHEPGIVDDDDYQIADLKMDKRRDPHNLVGRFGGLAHFATLKLDFELTSWSSGGVTMSEPPTLGTRRTKRQFIVIAFDKKGKFIKVEDASHGKNTAIGDVWGKTYYMLSIHIFNRDAVSRTKVYQVK